MPKATSKATSKGNGTQITPEPGLEKRTRRKFAVEYKL